MEKSMIKISCLCILGTAVLFSSCSNNKSSENKTNNTAVNITSSNAAKNKTSSNSVTNQSITFCNTTINATSNSTQTTGSDTSTSTASENSNIKKLYSETSRDTKLEAAITSVYKISKGSTVRYLYNKIDLNNDGSNEIFVDLISSDFVGSGGSSAAIFKIVNGSYVLVSKFTLVNTPVIVTNNITNGWRNLIMCVSGGGAETHYALLKYGTNGYPSNPSTQPTVNISSINGTAIISDDISPNIGLEFTVN